MRVRCNDERCVYQKDGDCLSEDTVYINFVDVTTEARVDCGFEEKDNMDDTYRSIIKESYGIGSV